MSLINKKACKQFALEYSKAHRNGKFTQISGSSFEWLEARVRNLLTEEIHRHPSIGKTLYLGGKEDKKAE